MKGRLGDRLNLRLWELKLKLFRLQQRRREGSYRISRGLDVLVGVMSVATIVALVLGVGFDSSTIDRRLTWAVMRGAQGVFAATIAFNLLFRTRATVRANGALKWVADGLVLLSLLPWAYPHPEHPWIPVLEAVFYSRYFLYSVLAFYSITEVCYGAMRLVGRRTNPSLLMAGSFVFFIFAGSLVLMLPRCTYVPLGYVDSLFVSTSAVCITGLTSVDLPTTFTPLGLLVIALLVQVGGLGVLTFTSFFAIFFSGERSIYNQLMLGDFIYSKSMNALVPALLYILGFTLVVELGGAVLVYASLPHDMFAGTGERLMVAGFHSLSSFCNAGFSYIPDGMSNARLMGGSQNIYLVTSLLIFAGGIGFPNLVNFKEILGHYLRKLHPGGSRKALRVHVFDLNTKLVLTTTSILLVVGAGAFFVLEYNNTLAGMTLWEKIVQSVFNSLTPRSAGFASVNPGRFLNATLVVVMLLMWIGGASQSLAGGIKVNTLAAVLLNLRGIVTGRRGIPAFGRNLAVASVRRANAVVILSILSLGAYVVTIFILEPTLPARAVVFECVSALFTVGTSLGITPELSVASKGVLCTAMFLGRVGIISLLCGFMGARRDSSGCFPTDSIIIN
ncbi:MAG: potassium transporter [Muribaculaceae bacterium]|nr:potassium transporter [Muribaculaceae bacterium]